MIISKGVNSVSGQVEYVVHFEQDPFCHHDDSDEFLEYENFSSLKELLNALSDEKLEEIRASFHDAERVEVVGVSFHATSEDKETTSRLHVGEKKVVGHISTVIDNDDVNSRLMTNIEKVKEIIDNTLEQYPIKY